MSDQSTQLELIEEKDDTILQVFSTGNGLEELLQRAEDAVSAFDHDMSTVTSRKKTASLAYRVSKLKTQYDNLGKQSVSAKKTAIKAVDANRKLMRDRLDVLRDEARKPLTDWEEDETERKNRHTDMIQDIKNYRYENGDTGAWTLEELKGRLEILQGLQIGDSFEEFKLPAMEARDETIPLLRALVQKAIDFTEEQERQAVQALELSKLRKEAAEREQKDRDAEIARRAAEAARLEAEATARAEADKKEQEAQARIDRAEKAKREAEQKAQREIQAGKDRVEAERREREENEEKARRAAELERQKLQKLASDKAHIAKVNEGICESLQLLPGMNRDIANNIIRKIKAGKIPNVTINY